MTIDTTQRDRRATGPRGGPESDRGSIRAAASAAEFDAAQDLIAAYFGARGQTEEREVLRRLAAAPWRFAGIECSYSQGLAYDATDTPVGAVDSFIALDRGRGLATCVGSNLHVAPAARGHGVGARLDAFQDEMLADAVAAAAMLPTPRMRVAGDLQPIDLDDGDTWRRMLLWGRRGYQVVPHEAFPLTHAGLLAPDGGASAPLASLVIVRGIGAVRIDRFDRGDLEALADVMAAISSALVDNDAGRDSVGRVRRAISVHPDDAVALHDLPGGPTTAEVLTPLLRSVAFASPPASPTAQERAWVAAWIARGGPP